MFTFVSVVSGVIDEVRRFDDQGEAERAARAFWADADFDCDSFVVTEYNPASGSGDQKVVFSLSHIAAER